MVTFLSPKMRFYYRLKFYSSIPNVMFMAIAPIVCTCYAVVAWYTVM